MSGLNIARVNCAPSRPSGPIHVRLALVLNAVELLAPSSLLWLLMCRCSEFRIMVTSLSALCMRVLSARALFGLRA